MNRLLLLPFCFSLLVFLASCDGDVRFTTDQPQGTPALAESPVVLRGVWVSGTDTLTILPKQLDLVRSSRRTISLSDTTRLGVSRVGTAYVFRAGDNRQVERVSGDSMTILTRALSRYRIGRDTVLKSFNGCWWLSTRADSSNWKVMQISVRKKQLVIAVPSLTREEKRAIQTRMEKTGKKIDNAGTFSQITPFIRPNSNEDYFIVSATANQLKQLQVKGLFRPVATFTKLSGVK